ncbi:MAG: ABC transporter permease subunit [Verrucomicrobia bacterium]|nr:ABC transporter permease subunit [Verrucomicrobiota bacterium]
MLLLAPAALAVAVLFARLLQPRLQQAARRWSRRRCAAADALKFAAGILLVLTLALALARLLAAAGLDPRGSLLGTYVQRNALVVGFVMGFAVIPIIYTVADDALAAVPDHLRSAALGAGATPWQTAVTIVIPTAMSGLFSAVMIGLGRAVGETMIVLMAAGNTPLMDWNLFNGFRTLSANIAVELPEAVRNSTHYRVLFLSALVLFALTFVVNTLAEMVRLRFRKKAVEL